jgi:hypothetical protein
VEVGTDMSASAVQKKDIVKYSKLLIAVLSKLNEHKLTKLPSKVVLRKAFQKLDCAHGNALSQAHTRVFKGMRQANKSHVATWAKQNADALNWCLQHVRKLKRKTECSTDNTIRLVKQAMHLAEPLDTGCIASGMCDRWGGVAHGATCSTFACTHKHIIRTHGRILRGVLCRTLCGQAGRV